MVKWWTLAIGVFGLTAAGAVDAAPTIDIALAAASWGPQFILTGTKTEPNSTASTSPDRPDNADAVGIGLHARRARCRHCSRTTVATNASLLRLSERSFRRAGLRRTRRGNALWRRSLRPFRRPPPSPGLRANGLSGGNQQKLLLGRELDRNPTVIVAHSPTQGLDIAATAAAHNALIDAAARGAAVIVISPDLDELIAMADRIVVLSAGKIVDALDLRSEPFRRSTDRPRDGGRAASRPRDVS